MFEKKQSVNQNFKNNYNRIIRINTQFKLQCTHQYSAEDLNQFYQDYRKLIQSFNSVCSARTDQDYKKRVQEEETQSILYWFTTQGYV